MRAVVDSSKCQGHTQCAIAAPTVFLLDELDGHARAIDDVIPAELEAAVRRAAATCPEQAITVEE